MDSSRSSLIVVAALLVGVAAHAGGAQFKFDKQDVTFQSGAIRMAGTLYAPRTKQPVPAVVLIHGSGQTDRSSLDYFAKFFAENGMAALAYDKRGVGKSEGPPFAWRDFSFDDLASDAAAGVAMLRERPGIDRARVGIFGVSQGGWVAPLAARKAGGVPFLVLVSASVSTVAADNLFERSARLHKEGFTDSEVAAAHAMHVVDNDVSRTGARFDEFQRLWDENKTKRWFRRVYLDDRPSPPQSPYRRWYRSVMDFDPVPVLRELETPAIWLFGDAELDHLSPVRQSTATLEELRGSGKDYEVRVFPGADHSLQMGKKEAPWRAPVADWLRKHGVIQ